MLVYDVVYINKNVAALLRRKIGFIKLMYMQLNTGLKPQLENLW